MSSLRQILAAFGNTLVLDAASSRIQVGWLSHDGTSNWQVADAEAGIGVFKCVEQLGVNVSAIRSFIFCDGPGSILGIRTVAMALRAWQLLGTRPMYRYCSLAVVAAASDDRDLGAIADARRGLWHFYRGNGQLKRVSAEELSGKLVMPEGFRHWSPLPAGVQPVPYLLEEILPQVADDELFVPTELPDAFLHEEPSYVTWTPQIHRAPATS